MKTVREHIEELFRISNKNLEQLLKDRPNFQDFLKDHGERAYSADDFNKHIKDFSPAGTYLAAAIIDIREGGEPSKNIDAFYEALNSTDEHTTKGCTANQCIIRQFAEATLRGCGQVWFQNNPITGLLLFVGIFYNSYILGLCTLLGTVASTAFAYAIGIDKEDIKNGLFGFNGALAGVAVGFYFNMDPLHWIFLIMIACFSTVLMAALQTFFSTWGVAPLTAPFVLASWMCYFGVYKFSAMSPNELIGPSAIVGNSAEHVYTIQTYLSGVTKGVGEVMFQDNKLTGVVFLLALAINSRAASIWAIFSAFLAIVTAQVLGGDESSANLGLYGYSAVLTGIALGSGVFFPISVRNALLTTMAVIITTLVQATVSVALTPLGMPPLTWPFIIVTWIFLFASKRHKAS